MATRIDFYPLSHRLVEASLATEVSGGQVSKVKVWLRSRIELLPTALQFITDNSLLPEIISRAALDEETTFSSSQQLSYTTEGDYHLYQLEYTVTTGTTCP